MSTLLPVLKVKFGKMEYFISYMAVNDLTRYVKFPSELEGWKDLSIEERYQRKINLNRIKKDIAPYFATDDSRFSGALVLAIMNHDNIKFEPIGDYKKIPGAYDQTSKNMGFLTLSGEEMLIPLDGQHRVKAFEFATTGKDEQGKDIPRLKPNYELGKDNVAVILMRFEGKTARRIFSKINRYAKPTNKGDNLITDDDDPMAVITRRLLGSDGVIPSRLVSLEGNTLNQKAREFTTLATFYEATKEIFNGLCVPGSGKIADMTQEQMEIHLKDIRKEWAGLLSKIDWWRKAIKDPDGTGDGTRQDIRNEMLLGKPVGQLALVKGYSLVCQDDKTVDKNSIYAKINDIDWGVDNKMWKSILINPNGRVMSGKTTVSNAAEFISYLLGVKFDNKRKRQLLEKIHGKSSGKSLPRLKYA